MGFDPDGVRFLMRAKRQGVSFARTAMIGRQGLHLDADQLGKALREYGYGDDAQAVLDTGKKYSEPFLHMLGAESIVSFDVSDYENADVIADFNEPLRYTERFTAVIDGGSLEHMFNYPQAVANCMRLVDIGGHFLGISPSNDSTGHGFYQFSPELFWRVFTPSNGFEMRHMWKADGSEIDDPARPGEHEHFNGKGWLYLYVIAQKVREVKPFARWPVQGHYE